jgi:UDP-glucose 4-epimerase
MNKDDLTTDLKLAVESFGSQLRSGDDWQIFWAAGVGAMSSTDRELEPETFALSELLKLLAADARLATWPGRFVLASSAGAIYAGSRAETIDENTPIAPTTPYARAKLAQESLLTDFTATQRNVVALIARISTLYGLGQSTGKQQGFISMVARRILRKQPIHVYVPFDTVRDYIIADDAAALMVATARSLPASEGAFTRIIASEHPTTIAEIVATFKRIVRRAPGIIISANPMSSLYTRRIQFRSRWTASSSATCRTSLHVGVSRVIAHERVRHFSKGL